MEIRNIILKLLKSKGQITISEFMEIALSRYSKSYYQSKNPFDQNTDFITSPEISQMFGEMIGVWIYQIWENKNKPKKINLVEFGPGRGILIRDILRVLSKTDAINYVNVFLYDINQVLIKEQKKTLSFFSSVTWVDNLEDIPKDTCLFIANEFFDALPINQYFKVKKDWHEVVLKNNPEGNQIIFDKISTGEHINEYLNYEHKNAKDGAILEESKISADYIRFLATHSRDYGSVSLLIDYGYDIEPNERSPSQYFSTLQGIKNHQYTPLLSDIGNVDISAHVDFNMIKKIANGSGAITTNSVFQKDFLIKLGIKTRLENLIAQNSELEGVLRSQYKRLTSSSEMGRLFKVIAISNINEKISV